MPKERQTIKASSVGSLTDILGPVDKLVPVIPRDAKDEAVVDDLVAPVEAEKPTAITPAMKAIEKKVLADMRREEAAHVLSWLNANGCLVFGALPKALAAIENGDHRR